jgi:hypothetical protein
LSPTPAFHDQRVVLVRIGIVALETDGLGEADAPIPATTAGHEISLHAVGEGDVVNTIDIE